MANTALIMVCTAAEQAESFQEPRLQSLKSLSSRPDSSLRILGVFASYPLAVVPLVP
jgi:hypothetical protein